MKKTLPRYLRHAKNLGRVAQILGHRLSVNPYPEQSNRWLAFRDGWLRSQHDPAGYGMVMPREPSITGTGGR